MTFERKLTRGLIQIFALFAAILTASSPGMAREVLLLTNEFRIMRDFSHITISSSDVKNAHVFVDTDRFIVSNLPAAENSELQQIAINGLGSKLQLVKSKDEANYLVQIRMYQSSNYAIRNPKQEFSRGFIMISLCKFPISNMVENCENLQYNYFQDYNAKEIFSSVFRTWLKQAISNVD
jgi:hypothetical protein